MLINTAVLIIIIFNKVNTYFSISRNYLNFKVGALFEWNHNIWLCIRYVSYNIIKAQKRSVLIHFCIILPAERNACCYAIILWKHDKNYIIRETLEIVKRASMRSKRHGSIRSKINIKCNIIIIIWIWYCCKIRADFSS